MVVVGTGLLKKIAVCPVVVLLKQSRVVVQ